VCTLLCNIQVVDYGDEILLPPGDGPAVYRWVVEFQCIEAWGREVFYGINFYARQHNDSAALQQVRETKVM